MKKRVVWGMLILLLFAGSFVQAMPFPPYAANGTNFCVYGSGVASDGINPGFSGYFFWYDYSDGSSSPHSWSFINDGFNPDVSPKCLKALYNIRSGGYGGGGFRLETYKEHFGANPAKRLLFSTNYNHNQYLSLWARTDHAGTYISMSMLTEPTNSGITSNPAGISSIAVTGAINLNLEWTLYQFPLQGFMNSVTSQTGYREWKLGYGGAAGAWHSIYIDEIWIQPQIFLPTTPVLLFPNNGLITNRRYVTLSWSPCTATAPAVVSKYMVVLTKDTNGLYTNASTTRVLVPGATTYTLPSQPDGIWFWKVAAVDSSGIPGVYSPYRTLTIDADATAPALLSPVNALITNGRTISFSWTASTCPNGIQYYNLAFSEYTNMTNSLTKIIPSTQYIFTNMTSKHWYWQVAPVDNSGYPGKKSVARRFNVTTVISQPLTLVPLQSAKLVDSSVLFRWSASTSPYGITNYRLTVSQDPLFISVVHTFFVAGTNYMMTGLSSGSWYWKVLPFEKTGLPGIESVIRPFTIDLTSVERGSQSQITSDLGHIILYLQEGSITNADVTTVNVIEMDSSLGIMGTGSQEGKKPLSYFKLRAENASSNEVNKIFLMYPAKVIIAVSRESALFAFDGVKWMKVGGVYDAQAQKLTAPIQDFNQEYALFAASKPETALNGITADGSFTPNNDGINDVLRFYFDNPGGLQVTIKILNMKGTLVRVINNPVSGEGWNGKDMQNKACSAGPYLYRIKIGDSTTSGTLVLIR